MTRLAQAYEALAEAAAAVALELRATAPPEPSGAPLTELLPFDEPFTETVTNEPHGSAAVCPAHGVAYRDGTYGPYCPSLSDDPEWSNRKGYCNITPKNAAVWLRKTAAAGKR